MGRETGRINAGEDRPGPSLEQVAGCHSKETLTSIKESSATVSASLLQTGEALLNCDRLQTDTVLDWQGERQNFFRPRKVDNQ